MSDLIDGVVVEYFDIDFEKAKMLRGLDPKDIWGDDCFDQNDVDRMIEQEEDKFINSFGE